MVFLQISRSILGRNISSCSGSILTTILLAVLAASNPVQAQGVTVSPSRIFFSVPAGQRFTERIKISNPDSSELVLNASLKDWFRDSLGNKIYFPSASLPHSNAGWMRVFPSQIILQPGESKEVTVTVEVPEAPPPVTNSMLFLTQVNTRPPVEKTDPLGRKVAVLIKIEIGIHLYNTLPSFTKKDIQFVNVEERTSLKDSMRVVAAVLHNAGEVPTDAFLRFELTHKETGKSIKLPVKALAMLPGATQVVLNSVPARLLAGPYQAALILDCGEDTDLKVAQKELLYE